MSLFEKHGPKSIRDFALLSWAVPGLLSVITSLTAFFALGLVDYSGSISKVISDLQDRSKIAARRLTGEILLGSSGATESVSRILEKELEIQKVLLTEVTPPCFTNSSESCFVRNSKSVTVYRKVMPLQLPHYVAVTEETPTYLDSLKPALLLWSTLPILLLLSLGIYIQRRYTRRLILQPIEELLETAFSRSEPPGFWPLELREISSSLSRSLEEREQAIFGQLARGVVHDIKTLLHSVASASDLVEEQAADSPKRAIRIEKLLRACRVNLPRMKQIIDLTLDGSREIPVHSSMQSLSQTIQQSIDFNQSLAASRSVTIEYTPTDIDLDHDTIQLGRALTNIIKNGIEALEESRAEKRILKLSVDASSSVEARIVIEDNGPGFGSQPGLVFRPLRSQKVHGSGLGLLISRKIIESHSGRIRADRSSTLSGALFEITLPRKTGEARQ